jgi:hypothetical protein
MSWSLPQTPFLLKHCVPEFFFVDFVSSFLQRSFLSCLKGSITVERGMAETWVKPFAGTIVPRKFKMLKGPMVTYDFLKTNFHEPVFVLSKVNLDKIGKIASISYDEASRWNRRGSDPLCQPL